MADIAITIKEEEDLYNKFDPSIVSEDVVTFIAERFHEVDQEIILTVISDTPIDTARLKAAFAVYEDNRQKQLKAERKINIFRQIRLFLTGLVIITICLLVRTKIDGIWPEVLSIIGSFAIWEAASIWLVANPKLRLKKHLLKELLEIEIKTEEAK